MPPLSPNVIVGSGGATPPSLLARIVGLLRGLTVWARLALIGGILVLGGAAWFGVHMLRTSHVAHAPQTPSTSSHTHSSNPIAQTPGTTTTPPSQTNPQTGTTTPAKGTPTAPSSGGGTGGNSGGNTGGNSGGGTGGGSTPPLTCPPLPAFPDENCTGYAHTGVTLHSCGTPNQFGEIPLSTAGATYDSCNFSAAIAIYAPNITITRSRIYGTVDATSTMGFDYQGLTLTDVEIDSSNALGGASIGNNDYTCIRCNVHGGTRGFNIGGNVVIRDSYSHGWHSQTGDHITGIGSNGGAHNIVDHNNISYDILNDPTGYACSSGLSVYGDDAPGNDDWTITNNLLNSASSYCMNIAGPPGKPYPFTNMHITGNHFGNVGARARNLPDSQCTEYGPIATNPSSWGVNGNVWSGNVDSNGNPVTP